MTMRVAGLTVVGLVTLRAITFGHGQVVQVVQAAPQPMASKYIDEGAGMTLDDAIAQALDHEPSLRAARADVPVAQGVRVQAGLRPNPSVAFSQQNEPAGTDKQTRVEVQWPLDLFRKAGRVQVAERQIEVTQQSVADRERRRAVDVRMKYGEVAAAVRVLAVSDDVLAATIRQHTLVSARVDEGATPPLERDVLRVEVQRLEADRILQAGQTERALIELKRLLGMAADSSLSLRNTLEQLVRRETAQPLTVDAAGSSARRPDVLEAQAGVGVSDAQIDRARRDGRPDMSLFGTYMRMEAGFPQRGFGELGDLERVRGVFHYVSAGVMVTVPLLNRNQGEVAAAQARRLRAAAELDAAQLTAASEIAAARTRDEYARQALAAYTSDARGLARQNLDVVRQTYELGRATLFDVLNEQRRYLEVERAYTTALREAYEARQALRHALGEVR
jgi:cobalt-zinc-cadmium efflux system outer membrane protein